MIVCVRVGIFVAAREALKMQQGIRGIFPCILLTSAPAPVNLYFSLAARLLLSLTAHIVNFLCLTKILFKNYEADTYNIKVLPTLNNEQARGELFNACEATLVSTLNM